MMVASTNTGNMFWQIQGAAYGNNETLDATWGTAVNATDAGSGTANQVNQSPATGSMTFSGTPAASDLAQFRIFRDSSNGSDTLTGTARLLGVMITYTRV